MPRIATDRQLELLSWLRQATALFEEHRHRFAQLQDDVLFDSARPEDIRRAIVYARQFADDFLRATNAYAAPATTPRRTPPTHPPHALTPDHALAALLAQPLPPTRRP